MGIGGDGFYGQRRRAQPLSADLLDQGEQVVGLQRMAEHPGSAIRGQVCLIEAQRQVAEPTQPLDENRLLAGLESQPARYRGWRSNRHRGAHLVADLAVIFQRFLQS